MVKFQFSISSSHILGAFRDFFCIIGFNFRVTINSTKLGNIIPQSVASIVIKIIVIWALPFKVSRAPNITSVILFLLNFQIFKCENLSVNFCFILKTIANISKTIR